MPETVDSLLVFQTVNLSMKAEKVLRAAGVPFNVLPLPKEITRGCSIAVGVARGNLPLAGEALDRANIPVEAIYSRRGETWEAGWGHHISMVSPPDQFAPPATTCSIYLDNNATTKPHPDVVRAVAGLLSEEPGNPSSLHSMGRRAKERVEQARESVARLIGAERSEIFFTSGGTESNNTALAGIAASQATRGDHIITLKTEHSSVLRACQSLESRGIRVTYLPVNPDGLVDLETLHAAIRPETILISIAWANNETGVIQPIREIAEIARDNNMLFHTDAVQAAGKVPIDVKADGVDLLSLSAHKLYGLKGVGALYMRPGVRIDPLLHGGGQEAGLRSGTENVPGIVGMGVAAGIALDELAETSRRLRKLRDVLYEDLKERIPWVKINGHPSKRLPNTLNLCFGDISGEEIAAFLDKEAICVSTGSACSEGEPEPSHVLTAMGLTDEEAQSSIRFSLGRDTTAEDIQRTVQAVARIVRRYR